MTGLLAFGSAVINSQQLTGIGTNSCWPERQAEKDMVWVTVSSRILVVLLMGKDSTYLKSAGLLIPET